MSKAEAIDFSRPPIGEAAAAKLIQVAAEMGDIAERHYLEIKGSDFDISKKTDKQKIAKFILGAANRDPDVAKRYFQGYAVMILGVDQNRIVGVEPTEMMELQHVIRPFLGASGPQWDVVRVPVQDSGKEVLIVLVDPPEFGQPPFPCRAEGDKLKDGAIYIRADGATREAKADEIDMLLRRFKRVSPDVKLEISVTGNVNSIRCDKARTLDEYIEDKEAALLAAMPSENPAVSSNVYATILSAPMLDPSTTPEDRTREEYRAEIKKWKDECAQSWGTLLDNVTALFGVNTVRIENLTTTFLRKVEVKIHLSGAVRAVSHKELKTTLEAGPSELGLPSSPRPWGPKSRIYGLASSLRSFDFNPPIFSPSSVSWSNTGSVDLTVDVGDLRPKQVFETEDADTVLVVPDDFAVKEITGTWTATADGINELFSGEIVVPVNPVRDMTEAVRVLLRLDKMPESEDKPGEEDQ